MDRPLFSVGEEVILCSVNYQHQNGDYTVLCVRSDKPREDATTGEVSKGYAYILNDGNGIPWAESALRKKPKPSDKSFRELMSDLDLVAHG